MCSSLNQAAADATRLFSLIACNTSSRSRLKFCSRGQASRIAISLHSLNQSHPLFISERCAPDLVVISFAPGVNRSTAEHDFAILIPQRFACFRVSFW
jgi:hypothetical protein